MITIGMLNYRKHPNLVKKAYACAAIAKMEGIGFFYFSPGNVNFDAQTILGYVYEKGQWIQKMMPFPDAIYNSSGMKTMHQKQVYRRLKAFVPFTSHPIGNKMDVHRKIKKIPEFNPYLIPSKIVKHIQTVQDFLKKYKKIVVKPLSGNHGDNVIFIENNGEQLEIIDGTIHKALSEEELQIYLTSIINSKTFLVQPFISCKTREGFPYDFRIHVQKNGTGAWGITLIYPRIGSKDGIISNISKGGYIGKLESFLDREFGVEGFNIQKSLRKFAIRFSEKFDALYKRPLDELGIDLGIDENHKIWIYEVNWRPGYVYRELDAAMNTIPYAAFLAKKNKLDT